MFGVACFAELTFADLFNVSGVTHYKPRKGRTTVVAITPGDGVIVTGPRGVSLKTKVVAVTPDFGTIVSYISETKLRSNSPDLKKYKLRTFVRPGKTIGDTSLSDFFNVPDLFVYRYYTATTKVTEILEEPGQIITFTGGIKVRTKVQPVLIDSGQVITYISETRLQSNSPDMKKYKVRTYVSPYNTTGN